MNGACVHNQLRQWRPKGLCHFEIPKKAEGRQLAIRWPRCSISPDMDSTNVCSAGHWQRVLNLNIDAQFGLNHRHHNDLFNGLKIGGMANHLTMALSRVKHPIEPVEPGRATEAMPRQP